MNKSKQQDVEALLTLAQDKSKASRALMASAFAELFSEDSRLLTSQDRSTMCEIVYDLIKELEKPIRRSVAERLSRARDVPRDLILNLANDAIDVAYPILIHSEVLQEDELIEIIEYRTMEHQMAIAMRPNIRARVSDALVATQNEGVISTLLENETAEFAEETLGQIVDKATEVESYQKPLINRNDLSPKLVEKLYWSVSAALREHVIEHFDIDLTTLDDAVEGATVETLRRDHAEGLDVKSAPPLLEQISESDETSMLYLVRQAQILDFVGRFAALTHLRQTLIRRLIFEPGGEGFAIACKAFGISKAAFIEMFIFFRQGRLGEKIVKKHEVPSALAFFEELERQDAVATVTTWRRDEGYLNALRLVKRPNTKPQAT